MSERKEQLIYNAVHEAIMKLRIGLYRTNPTTNVDTAIAQAGHAAGMAAIAAYRAPLRKRTATKVRKRSERSRPLRAQRQKTQRQSSTPTVQRGGRA